MKLNQQQQEAVETMEGPLLILAGAGSGKTTVAIQRIVHLIQSGVSPKNILAVTFTNEAVNELKERLEQAIGEEKAKEVWIHTFHSLCTRMLKEENKEGFKIVDEFESLRLMNQLVMKQKYDRKIAEEVYKNISSFKSEMVSPKTLATSKSNNSYIDWEKVQNMKKSMKHYMETVELYPLYQNTLKEKRSLDLDDLVLVVVRLLLTNQSMLEKYQEKFQFITADEFQDTNKVQYVLLKLLTDKYRNFAAVGDDFQSIFGFRNADIRNILSFEEDFKQAKILKL
jgi:DNA helicase-2/ATP-dependent DNA helicase PcrA